MNRPPMMELLQGLAAPGGQATLTVAKLEQRLADAKAKGNPAQIAFCEAQLAEAQSVQNGLKALFGLPGTKQ